MNTAVQKWGNSLALRIPSSLANDVHLCQGSIVDVSVVRGKMVVRSLGRRRHSLARMLKGITKKNLHSEVRWGKMMGEEAL